MDFWRSECGIYAKILNLCHGLIGCCEWPGTDDILSISFLFILENRTSQVIPIVAILFGANIKFLLFIDCVGLCGPVEAVD